MQNPKIEIAILVNGVVHKTTELNTEQLIEDLHQLEGLASVKYTQSNECLGDFAFDLYASEHAQEDVHEALDNPVISYDKGYIYGYWNQDGTESLVEHHVPAQSLLCKVYKNKVGLVVEDDNERGYDELLDDVAKFVTDIQDEEYLTTLAQKYKVVSIRVEVDEATEEELRTWASVVYFDGKKKDGIGCINGYMLEILQAPGIEYVHCEPMV